jgi:hypothetical protein
MYAEENLLRTKVDLNRKQQMAIFLTVVLTVYILVNLWLWFKGAQGSLRSRDKHCLVQCNFCCTCIDICDRQVS